MVEDGGGYPLGVGPAKGGPRRVSRRPLAGRLGQGRWRTVRANYWLPLVGRSPPLRGPGAGQRPFLPLVTQICSCSPKAGPDDRAEASTPREGPTKTRREHLRPDVANGSPSDCTELFSSHEAPRVIDVGIASDYSPSRQGPLVRLSKELVRLESPAPARFRGSCNREALDQEPVSLPRNRQQGLLSRCLGHCARHLPPGNDLTEHPRAPSAARSSQPAGLQTEIGAHS